jgi:hypothetical protein
MFRRQNDTEQHKVGLCEELKMFIIHKTYIDIPMSHRDLAFPVDEWKELINVSTIPSGAYFGNTLGVDQ